MGIRPSHGPKEGSCIVWQKYWSSFPSTHFPKKGVGYPRKGIVIGPCSPGTDHVRILDRDRISIGKLRWGKMISSARLFWLSCTMRRLMREVPLPWDYTRKQLHNYVPAL